MNILDILRVSFSKVRENKKAFLLFTAACAVLTLPDALAPLYRDALPSLVFQLCRMFLNNVVIRSLVLFPLIRTVFPSFKTASGFWKLSANWLLFYALVELLSLPYRIASHYLMQAMYFLASTSAIAFNYLLLPVYLFLSLMFQILLWPICLHFGSCFLLSGCSVKTAFSKVFAGLKEHPVKKTLRLTVVRLLCSLPVYLITLILGAVIPFPLLFVIFLPINATAILFRTLAIYHLWQTDWNK